jgi:flagellar hook-basal body complex protein FliE
VYWANGNGAGIHLGYNNPQYTNTCNWDWADLTGQDIEVWFGYYTMNPIDCTVLDIDGFLTQCSDEYDGQIGLLDGLRTDVDANTGAIAGILGDINGRINNALSAANTGITNNANEISRVESEGATARGELENALTAEIDSVETASEEARGALGTALRGEISSVATASEEARGDLENTLTTKINGVAAASNTARVALGVALRSEISGVETASETARGELDAALRNEIDRVESKSDAKIAELILTIEDIQRTLTALKGNAAGAAQSRFAPNYNYYDSSLLNRDYIIAFLVILNAMIVCIGCCIIYSKKESGSYRKVSAFATTDEENDRQQLNL